MKLARSAVSQTAGEWQDGKYVYIRSGTEKYIYRSRICWCRQWMEDGQNGQCGTSAAPHVDEVKGQGLVNVIIQLLRSEVTCVTVIRLRWTLATSDIVQVRIS